MKHAAAFFAAALLLAAPVSAQQAPVRMTLEQTMLLRCSALFAIVAGEQDRGVARALAYPPLRERGREFFVQSAARLIDELNWSSDQIEAALRTEAEQFQADMARSPDRSALIDSFMQPCLVALDGTGI